MAPDAMPPSLTPPSEPKGIRSFKPVNLRTSFLTGIVVAAPIAITIYLVWSFIAFVDNQVRPIVLGMMPDSWHHVIYEYAAIPGLGLLILVGALTLLGMLTANMVGRTLLRWGDLLAHRTPIVGTIYRTLRQIVESVVTQTEPAFKQVGLIEYPAKGMFRLVFVIGNAKGEIRELFDDDMLTVFMPSTPNPMAGYVSFIPKKNVRILDMSIEDGVKTLVSAGIAQPEYAPVIEPVPRPARTPGLLDRWAARRRTRVSAG